MWKRITLIKGALPTVKPFFFFFLTFKAFNLFFSPFFFLEKDLKVQVANRSDSAN